MKLFKDYKPMIFFGWLSLIFFVLAVCFGLPVFIEYFETGLVERFPTLIFAGFLMIASLLMIVCGLILEVIVTKYRQMFELMLIRTREEYSE